MNESMKPEFELGNKVNYTDIIPDISSPHGLATRVFAPDKLWEVCGVCLCPKGWVYRMRDENQAYTGWVSSKAMEKFND